MLGDVLTVVEAVTIPSHSLAESPSQAVSNVGLWAYSLLTSLTATERKKGSDVPPDQKRGILIRIMNQMMNVMTVVICLASTMTKASVLHTTSC